MSLFTFGVSDGDFGKLFMVRSGSLIFGRSVPLSSCVTGCRPVIPRFEDSLEGKAVCCFRMPDGSGLGFVCVLILLWCVRSMLLLMNRPYASYSSGAKTSGAGVLAVLCL